MAPETKNTEQTEAELRNVGISIVRQGEKIKIKVGKHEAELTPLEGKSQVYPFFAFAQWMTETAVGVLAEKQGKQAVFSSENREAAKSALESIGFEADDNTADRVVTQIHEDLFGGR